MSAARKKAWSRAVSELKKKDRRIHHWVSRRKGIADFQPPKKLPPYQVLVHSIISQQISGAAARTILARLLSAFPGGKIDFDRLSRQSIEELRVYGVSRNKALSLIDLAAKVSSGELPDEKKLHRMPDDEIIERLTVVRGIGVWTVQMLLMFRLERMDVFPAHDLGIQKGYAKLTGQKRPSKPKVMLKKSEQWKPYRTVVAKLLWAIVDEA